MKLHICPIVFLLIQSQSHCSSQKIHQDDSQHNDSTENTSPPPKRLKLELASPQSCTYVHSRKSPHTELDTSKENSTKDTKISVLEIQDSPPLMTTNEKSKEYSSVDTDSGKQEVLKVDECATCATTLDSTADNKCLDLFTGEETKNVSDNGPLNVGLSSPGINTSEKKEKFLFSPDEHSNILMNTQINRQIEKVKKFLRTDRLRRTKDTVKFTME